MTYYSINDLLIFTSVAIAGFNIARLIFSPAAIFRFSVLFSIIFSGWALPQLFAIRHGDNELFGTAHGPLLMMIICQILVNFGEVLPSKRFALASQEPAWNPLLVGALVLTVFGIFFALKIRALPAESTMPGAWSGPSTIYLFFARTQILAFAVGWIVFLRTRSRLALLVVILNLPYFLDAIFLGARRAAAGELGLIVISGLYFCRGWVPRRSTLMVLVLVGIVFVSVAPVVRSIVAIARYDFEMFNYGMLEELAQIDIWATVTGIDAEGSYELTNAITAINLLHENGRYDFGVGFWNDLVFRYIPGQWVGFDMKQSLMTDDILGRLFLSAGVEVHPGATMTGFTDAFRSAGFAGSGLFVLLAWAMSSLRIRAEQGSFWSQYGYAVTIDTALHAVTHGVGWFIVWIPYVVIFSLGMVWLGRSRAAHRLASHRRDLGSPRHSSPMWQRVSGDT